MDLFARAFFAVLTGLLSALAHASVPAAAPTAWERLDQFTVRIGRSDSLDFAAWRGAASFASNDLRVEVEQVVGAKRSSGSLLLTGGEVLVARGLESDSRPRDVGPQLRGIRTLTRRSAS